MPLTQLRRVSRSKDPAFRSSSIVSKIRKMQVRNDFCGLPADFQPVLHTSRLDARTLTGTDSGVDKFNWPDCWRLGCLGKRKREIQTLNINTVNKRLVSAESTPGMISALMTSVARHAPVDCGCRAETFTRRF